jgi:hypothetical protein
MNILDIKEKLMEAFNEINEDEDLVEFFYIYQDTLDILVANKIVNNKIPLMLWGAGIIVIDKNSEQRAESVCGIVRKLEFMR